MIVLLMLLFAIPTFAQEAQKQLDTPGIGAYYDENNNAALTLGDYNLFDQTQSYYGAIHYGGGGGRLEFGNPVERKFSPNVGIHAQGNNGTSIFGLAPDERNALFPQLGAELFNGRINLNTSSSIQDYYEGFIGPSVGVHGDISGCRFLPLVRGGGAAGTLGKNGLLPSFHLAYGYAGHMSCYVVDFSYGMLKLHDKKGQYMEDAAVMFNLGSRTKAGFVMERTKGIFEETSYSILIKNLWE